MIHRILRRSRQRGDTIIEVLICIMIVSLVLTGAYVTTNRSTLAIRDSQEHAEALKLIQGQLEQLRQSAVQTNTQIFSSATPFCMVNNGPVSASDQPAAAACTQSGDGNPTTEVPAYKLAITRNGNSSPAIFTVRATWDSVTGNSQAAEQIVYRLYK